MDQIPVYSFTGFLDSGKTKFIQDTLEDPRFNAGERTLLLAFEEGEEEFDISKYPHQEVYYYALEAEDTTEEKLLELEKKHRIDRVVCECNGMLNVEDIYSKFPQHWGIAQEVMFADATTFLSYNANMRNLVMDKLVGAELVVFNRMTPGADVMPFHKVARAANRNIDIMYDYTDGKTSFDEIEDPLPIDINAPIIELKDSDYALWYRDVSEEPQKYVGKTVKFKAQVAMLRRNKDTMFAPGRFVMTCCEADIQFCGIPCYYDKPKELKTRSWIWVTAKISAEPHALYQGDVGPILTCLELTKDAVPAAPEFCTF